MMPRRHSEFTDEDMAVARSEAKAFDLLIGRNIRTARMEKAMSQEALASELGVSFQQVQKYENGSNRVAGSRLCQIARACSVPVPRLFFGIPNVGLDVSTDQAQFAAQQVRLAALLDELDQLPGKLQTQFRRMVSAMREVLREGER